MRNNLFTGIQSRFIVIGIALSLFLVSQDVCGQQTPSCRPLSFNDLTKLLTTNSLKQEDIIIQVQRCKVDFDYTTDIAVNLATDYKAQKPLLEAIKNNRIAVELEIVAPRKDQICGDNEMVSCRGEAQHGKYLWLFAHRQSLTGKWWPQNGEPLAKNVDNTWSGSVRLGESVDAGKQFEIVAIWVDEQTNLKMLDWVKRSDEAQKWPFISLPAGNPRDTVTLIRN